MKKLQFPGIEQCLLQVSRLNSSRTDITIPECEQQCGIGYAPYKPEVIINAIATWMLPLFLLVGNVEYSNFDFAAWQSTEKDHISIGFCDVLLSRINVLCHLLGNPVGYIHSHLQKLEDMRQELETLSSDPAAVVCIALLDFPGTTNLRERIMLSIKQREVRVVEACRRSALTLVNSRTGSTRRTALAIIVYAATLFIALILAMNQDDMPLHSPHTVALRMLYYWLITAAALSSATGAFPTEYTAWNDLRPVFEALPNASGSVPVITNLQHGSYGHARSTALDRRFWVQAFVGLVAVFTACACSFAMSWLTPTQGLGCRNFVELGFFVVWLLSFVISNFSTRVGTIKGFRLVPVSTATDIIFAILTVLGQFLGWSGWYNSCKCWGAWWTIPDGKEYRIMVDLAGEERKLASTYYGLISGALATQILLSAGILLMYRSELKLIYGKSEALKQLLPKR